MLKRALRWRRNRASDAVRAVPAQEQGQGVTAYIWDHVRRAVSAAGRRIRRA